MKNRIVKYLIYFIFTCCAIVLSCNLIVIFNSKDKIDIDFRNYDAIVVLGCKLDSLGRPSRYLAERLDTTYDVYAESRMPVIISGSDEEVYVMRDYLIDLGIDENDITVDSKGVNTYNSFKNLDNNYKKIVIISQKYHLYRSIYLAEHFGYESVGISSYLPGGPYWTIKNTVREYLSRTKMVFQLIFD